jgi:sialidase-1
MDGTPLTAVFPNGEEGYACFRIPSIIRAGDGSLVAFAEGRVENCADFGGVIRIVARRSTDDGHTWGPLMVAGRNCLPDGSERVASNPSPVVDCMDPDHPHGVIFLVYNKTEFSEFEITAHRGVRRVYVTRSIDHGQTWEGERDITGQVHRPNHPLYRAIYADAAERYAFPEDWRQQVTATGHGIQLRGGLESPATAGRLFFTGSITVGARDVYHSQNYAFWSDDHGQSWVIGGISALEGLNEAMAVELEDGSVMVNARNYRRDGQRVGLRAVLINTFDRAGRVNFGTPREDPVLIEPTIQASIERFSFANAGGKNQILFSIPDHLHERVNLTVRLSYDEGKTWALKKTIDPGQVGYADLVVQADRRIGLLYERAIEGINYVSFSLAWLSDSADSEGDRANSG